MGMGFMARASHPRHNQIQVPPLPGFSRNQNNHDLSGASVLQSEREDKHMWNTWHTKIFEHFVCICFQIHVVSKYCPLELNG